ncbi:hypothetical protein SCRES3_gp115 [Synechococcus phage S-CRES3]|nr:hypothetical protein SCRES3_gp115 [Synechococcus phage S-CRES3]
MSDTLKGLVVEIIRLLWHHGYYRQNKWLKLVHENWFQYWVDFKTQQTMADVDRQIEELRQPSGVDAPIYTETETELRLTAPWHETDDEASL